MKKLFRLKFRNFVPSFEGLLVPLFIAEFLFASCNKEDRITPNQAISNLSSENTVGSPDYFIPPIVPPIPSNALMFISHGSCIGNCPVYSTTVSLNGLVTYVGKGNVGTFGTYQYKMDLNKINELENDLMKNGFYELPNSYPYVADASQTVTAVYSGTAFKVVVDYGINAPESLRMMQNTIEATLGINHLVNGDLVDRLWVGVSHD